MLEANQQKYLTQIKILNTRLKYVKYMQLFSAIAFILNLLTILFGIYYPPITSYLFSFCITLFSFALLIFVIEINVSSNALKTHLEDIGEQKNINNFIFSNKIYLSFFLFKY